MPYQPHEFVKAWTKAVFGLIVAGLIASVFNSFLLFWITALFLVYLPFQNENIEKKVNSLIFGIGMLLVMLAAFDVPLVAALLGFLGAIPTLLVSLLSFGQLPFPDILSATGFGLDLGITGGQLIFTGFLFALIAIFGILRILVSTFGRPAKSQMKGILTALLVMLFIVFLIVSQPWTWAFTAILFSAFWLIAFFTGLAGDQETRAFYGVIFILVSFFIFAAGVGTQEVGAAFFGQFWPTVYQGITAVTTPLGEVFQGLGSGFGNAFLLLTNPAAYAQSIVNGSFQKDSDTGLTGAFGVEMTELKLTPLFAEQPYSALIKIQNKGSFKAKEVTILLRLGGKPPKGTSLKTLGFSDKEEGIFCNPDTTECYQYVDKNPNNELFKIDLRQVFFPSEGISCKDIITHELRKRFLPLEGTVSYKYRTDATIDLEFISTLEWDRLVQAGTIQTQVKKPATLKNSPVQLNIDTLEQPIREGTGHYIGLSLIPAKSNGKIINGSISLELPSKLLGSIQTKEQLRCFPKKPDIFVPVGDSMVMNWSAKTLNNNNIVYCTLPGFNFKEAGIPGAPSQTFVIKASADYTFEETRAFTPGKIEFAGNICCKEDTDCPGTLECNKVTNICGELGAAVGVSIDVILAQFEQLKQEFEELKQAQDLSDQELKAELLGTIANFKAIITQLENLKAIYTDPQDIQAINNALVVVEGKLQETIGVCEQKFGDGECAG